MRQFQHLIVDGMNAVAGQSARTARAKPRRMRIAPPYVSKALPGRRQIVRELASVNLPREALQQRPLNRGKRIPVSRQAQGRGALVERVLDPLQAPRTQFPGIRVLAVQPVQFGQAIRNGSVHGLVAAFVQCPYVPAKNLGLAIGCRALVPLEAVRAGELEHQ